MLSDAAPVQGRGEAHRATQLDHELVELRRPFLLREQQRFRGQPGRPALRTSLRTGARRRPAPREDPAGTTRPPPPSGPASPARSPHRVARPTAARTAPGPRPRPGESPTRDTAAEPRAKSTASSHSWHPRSPTRRLGADICCALRGYRRPVHVCQDLSRVNQQHRAGRAQPHVMSGPFQQDYIQFTFQPLQLLTQRRLADMFADRGTTEMQFLGQSNEVTQLPKLQLRVPPVGRSWNQSAVVSVVSPIHEARHRRPRSSAQETDANAQSSPASHRPSMDITPPPHRSGPQCGGDRVVRLRVMVEGVPARGITETGHPST